MTLRRITANPVADNPPDYEQQSSEHGLLPVITIDDATGVIYIAGIPVVQIVTIGRFSGPGDGPILGFNSIVDINADDSVIWPLTIRNKDTSSGEGLTFYVDNNGDAWIQNAAADGTTLNSIILRGVGNSSYVRFGPDVNNGVSVGVASGPGTSLVTIDGNIHINEFTGNGVQFQSVGGGVVNFKPASFGTSTPTQLLINADGHIPVMVAAPASASSTGVPNSIAFDSGFFYVCVATDTWKRAALSTW